MKSILFVDDDPHILSGLRRMLHSARDQWNIQFAGSGKEALDLLAASDFDLIVTDMRMPGMDGAQLLDKVAKRHPRLIRLVLSGHSDEQTILRSIAPAHQYLSKPCNADVIISTIQRACALRDLLANDALKGLTSKLKGLPSLPSLYQELMKTIQSTRTSLSDVGRIVSKDVAMSARILQLVNSAFFGIYRHVASPEEAVSILGLNTIKALVLSVHLFSEFRQKNIPGFPIERMSTHSVLTGAIAKIVAARENGNSDSIDEAFIAGLLHDTGKLILAENLPRQYAEVLESTRGKQIPLWQAERDAFGSSHAEVGAYLLGLWGLSNPVIEAVAYHHNPAANIHNKFTPLTAVYAADSLEHQENSREIDGPVPTFDMDYLESLHLADHLPAWRAAAQDALEKTHHD